jgi:hypothetical protein
MSYSLVLQLQNKKRLMLNYWRVNKLNITSLKDLEMMLLKKINSAMKQEVAKASVEEMQHQIEEVVYSYDAAQPELRRMYNDGLIDPRNIEITVEGNGSIAIENIAYDGDRNVPYIVESGIGYFEGASSELTSGRKFTEATRDSLRTSNILSVAMAEGLARQGIKAE